MINDQKENSITTHIHIESDGISGDRCIMGAMKVKKKGGLRRERVTKYINCLQKNKLALFDLEEACGGNLVTKRIDFWKSKTASL